VLVKLGLFAYQFAGRWGEGVSVLDEALKVAGATVPPNDKVRIKYNQAQFTVPLDQPEAASRAAKEAIAALPACGAKCSAKETQDLVTAITASARRSTCCTRRPTTSATTSRPRTSTTRRSR
jgi:hypothetical protein